MLWIIPTWLASVVLAALYGYHFRGLTKKIEHLEQAIQTKVGKQPEPEEPKSEVIDPLDEVQTAMYEHKKMMEKLNPNE
jgi:hypothetical protein